jgi:hypothetical protein
MLTHNIAMWYMDLGGGWFRDDRIMAEIKKLKKWGDYTISAAMPRRREAEVAVISSLQSEFYLPRRASRGNNIGAALYVDQIGELCRAGAPFDSYLVEDVFSPKLEEYRVIICLDCMYLSDEQFARLRELQQGGRLFIWFYAPGMFNGKDASFERMEKLSGFRLGTIDAGRLRAVWNGTSFGRDDLQTPLYYPLDGEVLSAGSSAVMMHATSAGDKKITLKHPARATEIVSGKCYGEKVTELEFKMEFGETAIFILE